MKIGDREVRKRFDHRDDGPQVIYHGRVFVVSVSCCLPDEVTEGQIKEAIRYMLGEGGVDNDNPVENEINNIDVIGVTDTEMRSFTLWNAKGEGSDDPNERKGRFVTRHATDDLQDFVYERKADA